MKGQSKAQVKKISKKIKKVQPTYNHDRLSQYLKNDSCTIHKQQFQFYDTNCHQFTCSKCLISTSHIKHIEKQLDLDEVALQMCDEQKGFEHMNAFIDTQTQQLDEIEGQIIQRTKDFFQKLKTQVRQPIDTIDRLNKDRAVLVRSLLNKRTKNRQRIMEEFFKKFEEFQTVAEQFKQVEPLQQTTSQRKHEPGIKIEDQSMVLEQGKKSKKKQKEQRQQVVHVHQQCHLQIENEIIHKQILTVLDNNILFNPKEKITQTSYQNQPKYLHWFEWGKRKLALYDLSQNISEIVDLNIQFKIPSFSRSIYFSQTCSIFLFGGEEPEYHARREVYMFDLFKYKNENQNRLIPKSKMPLKKFDFTLAEMDAWIYILSGKNGTGEVVASCHRYNPISDQYQPILNMNHPRYAASAASIFPNIYVFGGRGGQDNSMIQAIEIYNVENNTWSDIQLHPDTANFYVPVEVCGCIAINSTTILIFGGCDSDIKDLDTTLYFHTQTKTLEKKSNMIYPQVFVTPPFFYGKNIYAMGNEYYLKQRCLHKYNIDSDEWKILI